MPSLLLCCNRRKREEQACTLESVSSDEPCSHVALDLLQPVIELAQEDDDSASAPSSASVKSSTLASMRNVAAAISRLSLRNHGVHGVQDVEEGGAQGSPHGSPCQPASCKDPQLRLEQHKQAVQEVSAALGGAEPEGQLVIHGVLGTVGGWAGLCMWSSCPCPGDRGEYRG